MQVGQVSNAGSHGLVAPREPRVSGDPPRSARGQARLTQLCSGQSRVRSKMTGPGLRVGSQQQHWRGESRTFKREKGSASGSIVAA